MNASKLKARDLITTAVFSVIFFLIVMVGSMTFGVVPMLYPFLVSFIALVGGTVWAYMRVKVPKRFAIAIQAVITTLLLFLLGSGWALALGFLVGGIAAEIIAGIGQYRSFKLNCVGYAAFCVCFHLGGFLMPLTARQYYIELSVASGMDAALVELFLSFISWPVLILGAALTCVFAVVGMLLGRKLLKKHFVKAGIM